jgi:hypothetical protein
VVCLPCALQCLPGVCRGEHRHNPGPENPRLDTDVSSRGFSGIDEKFFLLLQSVLLEAGEDRETSLSELVCECV